MFLRLRCCVTHSTQGFLDFLIFLTAAQHCHIDTAFCTIRKSHVTWNFAVPGPHSEEIRRCILLFLCTLDYTKVNQREKGWFQKFDRSILTLTHTKRTTSILKILLQFILLDHKNSLIKSLMIEQCPKWEPGYFLRCSRVGTLAVWVQKKYTFCFPLHLLWKHIVIYLQTKTHNYTSQFNFGNHSNGLSHLFHTNSNHVACGKSLLSTVWVCHTTLKAFSLPWNEWKTKKELWK